MEEVRKMYQTASKATEAVRRAIKIVTNQLN